MGKIYAKAIIKGDRTLASVPDMWRTKTLAALRELCTEEELADILEEDAA